MWMNFSSLRSLNLDQTLAADREAKVALHASGLGYFSASLNGFGLGQDLPAGPDVCFSLFLPLLFIFCCCCCLRLCVVCVYVFVLS